MDVVLINGLRESAGKTTTTLGLHENLSQNRDVNLFKPLAGNDYWYDHDLVVESLEKGTIYGHDARELSKQTGNNPLTVNPFHRLWCPPQVLGKKSTTQNRYHILDRVKVDEEQIIIENKDIEIPKKIEEKLNPENRLSYSGMSELNDFIEENYLSSIKSAADHLMDCDLLLVESYSQVAIPSNIGNIDAVVTVEPGKAYIMEGSRYMDAENMQKGIYQEKGINETNSRRVLEMLNPEEIQLKPSTTKNHKPKAKTYKQLTKKIKNHLNSNK
ncbi:MAG: putative P-loop ATPase/GTPase [Candidatus Methanohalarchaeum thermophilum]|uniref:P-loop ATPase/GTPase n=1 Tax=Methanohalarchaeum thermophilum TaxID=1903181 RepID=A0A1Q6DT29_METT1|nr:MAG: putative P-loop ATPase/GTPase [Candidatus Methanohalarchaeum thermophilum]